MKGSTMGRYVLKRRVRIRRNYVGFVSIDVDIVVVSFLGFMCECFFLKGE